MKTLRLTTHLHPEQVITIIDFMDQMIEALCVTYQSELGAYEQAPETEHQDHDRDTDEPVPFDDLDLLDERMGV